MRSQKEIRKTHDELKSNIERSKIWQNVENENYLRALHWVLEK